MLEHSDVATRLPVQDLKRARSFYAEKLGLEPIEERLGGLLYRCERHRPDRRELSQQGQGREGRLVQGQRGQPGPPPRAGNRGARWRRVSVRIRD